MSYETFISFRYLKAKRKQTFVSLITFISIGGVAIGVTALIVVLAVMTGAQDDIREKIIGANSHILVTSVSPIDPKEKEMIIDTVKKMEGVVAASAFIYNQVIITSVERVSGIVLRGIDTDPVPKSTDIGKYMTDGNLEYLSEKFERTSIEPDDFGAKTEIHRHGVILGRELARNLGVMLGDPVTIISPMGKMTPVGMTPISRQFYVAGIFHTGMYEFDSSLALISIGQAQSLFKMGENVTGIEIKVEDIDDAPEIADKIQLKIGFPYSARDWQKLNQSLFFALALEKTVIGLILILIIFVAAFNIVSTLIMVVLEKTKDIAILKALGASRGAVMKIFFLEGLIIGFTGTALGVAGGVLLCEILKKYQFIKLPSDVYNMETLPVSMNFPDVVVVSLAAMFITALAALYPAWSASKIDPAESLRYE